MPDNIVVSVQRVDDMVTVGHQFERFKCDTLSTGLWPDQQRQVTEFDGNVLNWTKMFDI